MFCRPVIPVRNSSIMPDEIRFHATPFGGIDAMSATTVRSFPRHTHDQYGLGVIDSGGHASLSDRGQVEAGPRSMIFVNPGEVHDGRAIAGRQRSWRMLYFESADLQRVWDDIGVRGSRSLAFAAPTFADETLRALFNVAFRRVTKNAASRSLMECETAILGMVARARLNSTAQPQKADSGAPRIGRVRELIDADPASPELTLTRLAREAGLSRYQLLRGFSREFGLTPHAYILQRRIALARQLIRAGSGLADASLRAGFFDQSHFTHVFSRQTGVAPGHYALRTR